MIFSLNGSIRKTKYENLKYITINQIYLNINYVHRYHMRKLCSYYILSHGKRFKRNYENFEDILNTCY